MKKPVIILSLALAIIFGGSCKKSTDSNIAPSPSSISTKVDSTIYTKNGRLVFNQEYYQSLSNSPEGLTEAISKIQALKFKSIRSVGPSDKCRLSTQTLDSLPTILKEMLNTDGLVQIGDYIAKLNFENQTVLVLNQQHESELYDLISENVNNKHIQVFSMEDEVLTLLQNTSSKVSLCFKKGAPSNSTGGTIGCTGYNNVSVALKYEKFGVWFELNVDIRTNSNNDKRAFNVNYYAWYEKKCSGKTYTKQNVTTETNDKVVVKQYSGTASLSSYYLEASVMCAQPGCNSYYGTLSY